MYILQVQGKQPKVIVIDRAEQFDDFNQPGFSYLLKKEDDLQAVPLSALVGVYNSANPTAKLLKFSSHADANKRVWPIVLLLAGAVASAPTTEPKPAKQPKQQGPSLRGRVGIVARLYALLAKDSGVSVKEAVTEMTTLFPERKPKAMEGTMRQSLSVPKVCERYAPGKRIDKRKDEARGMVYKLVEA